MYKIKIALFVTLINCKLFLIQKKLKFIFINYYIKIQIYSQLYLLHYDQDDKKQKGPRVAKIL